MHWLSMGGYAQFVWPSYALALLAIGLNIYWARRLLQRARDEVRRRLAMSRPDQTAERGER